MKQRRKTQEVKKLCSGPGKLCMALGITRVHYGADLCAAAGALIITDGEPVAESQVLATPRINVDYSGEAALLPYRFILRDSEFLSVKTHVFE
jgi:DNA-3-methyladenine glycosylase